MIHRRVKGRAVKQVTEQGHSITETAARLMRQEGLRSQTRPGYYSGKTGVISPNHLDRRFKVAAPNVAWATDVTYIRTYEDWLYLSMVIDMFYRQVGVWAIKRRVTSDLALESHRRALWCIRIKAVSSAAGTGKAF